MPPERDKDRRSYPDAGMQQVTGGERSGIHSRGASGVSRGGGAAPPCSMRSQRVQQGIAERHDRLLVGHRSIDEEGALEGVPKQLHFAWIQDDMLRLAGTAAVYRDSIHRRHAASGSAKISGG